MFGLLDVSEDCVGDVDGVGVFGSAGGVDDFDCVSVCSGDDKFVASVCGYVYAEADGVEGGWVGVVCGVFNPCGGDYAVSCDFRGIRR